MIETKWYKRKFLPWVNVKSILKLMIDCAHGTAVVSKMGTISNFIKLLCQCYTASSHSGYFAEL